MGNWHPGAVIKDEALVQERVGRLLKDGTVLTIDGHSLSIEVQSILVHSDTPHSLAAARGVRQAIAAAGGTVRAMSRF